MAFDKSSNERCCQSATFHITLLLLLCFCRFGFFFWFVDQFLLLFFRCLSFSSILSLNLQEEFSDLAYLFFLEMNFFDDTSIRSSNFSELFVRCHISKFLEFFNFFPLAHINLLDGALFDSFSQIR